MPATGTAIGSLARSTYILADARRPAQKQARQAKGKRENRYMIKVMNGEEKEGRDSWARETQRFNLAFLLVQ
jgi:hypothetical protein